MASAPEIVKDFVIEFRHIDHLLARYARLCALCAAECQPKPVSAGVARGARKMSTFGSVNVVHDGGWIHPGEWRRYISPERR
jgi:hypothetical protein